MATDTPYEILGTDKTFCPECRGDTLVLSPVRVEDFDSYPAFYICTSCLHIGQIGVGPVPRIQGR